MRPLNILITLLSFAHVSTAYEVICPKIPYTAVSIEVIPQVSFNKKSALYKYQYTFKNNTSSQLPISRVRMETFQAVLSAKATHFWGVNFSSSQKKIIWGAMPDPTLDSLILPGKSLDGFEFESPNPPGPMRFEVGGYRDILDKNAWPRVILTKAESEEYAHDDPTIRANCPGEDIPSSKDFPGREDSKGRKAEINGITIGPIPPNTIIAKLRLKKITDKKWHDNSDDNSPTLEISPLDTGKIQLMLFDDKDIDVSKIDLTSIKFGPGDAAPIKTEFTQYVDDEKDSKIVEHLKKHNKSHLLMEFNLAALKVECDIDRALFFNAKIGDKKLSGAVKIKHALCSDVHRIKNEKDKSTKIKKLKAQD